MSMDIKIRDYRGVKTADIALNPIALVSGVNASGKTSLAQAVQAALTGKAIVIPGVAKKDAKCLVHDGADKGYVSISQPHSTVEISWPKCDVKVGETDETWASDYAAGIKHLVDLDDRERALVLAEYIDSSPNMEDICTAVDGFGYSEESIKRLWDMVGKNGGWDDAYKRTREYSTKLKGQWEQATSEKYGSKKAEGWKPEHYPIDMLSPVEKDPLLQNPRQHLEEIKRLAAEMVEHAIGAEAVAQVNLDELRVEAVWTPDLEKNLKDAEDNWERLDKAWRELRDKGAPSIPREPMSCPSCSTPLKVDGSKLVEVKKGPTAKQIKDAEKALKLYNKDLADAEKAAGDARTTRTQIGLSFQRAQEAQQKLIEAESKGPANDTGIDLEAARKRLFEADRAINAYDAKVTADKIHAELVKNERLTEVLAPEGLRRRKLAARLEIFNDGLEKLSNAAKWPVVRIDEKLNVHFGTRPLWAASSSGQWRARAVIQALMAQLDKSAAIVLDEADILDSRGRNGLFAMLQKIEPKSLVCMTINNSDLVPNLAKAGFGRGYWIDAGTSWEIVEA